MRQTNQVTAKAATNNTVFVAASFIPAKFIYTARYLLMSAALISTAPTAMAGAGTWTTSTEAPSSVNAIAMDPYVPSQIITSFGSGLARTGDSGTSWEKEVHGADPTPGKVDTLPAGPTTTLTRLPSHANILFSGTSSGYLYRTTTNAIQPSWPTMVGEESLTLPSPLYKTWDKVRINNDAAIVGAIQAVAAHPRLPNIAVSVKNSGIFVTTNANAPSTCVVSELSPTPTATDIDTYTYGDAVPATNSVTITRTAVTGLSPSVSIAVSGATAFTLTNTAALIAGFGATPASPVVPTTSNNLTFLAPTIANSSTLKNSFCVPRFPNQTYTWSAGTTIQNPALPNVNTQIPYGSIATALVFDPNLAATNFIYAGLDGKGVYYSADKGSTWLQDAGSTPSSSTPQNIQTMIATQINGKTVLYAATTGAGTDAGVFKGTVTYDNAASPTSATISWLKLPATLDGQSDPRGLYNIRALAVDTIAPNKLYAGTFGYGVYSLDTSTALKWTDLSNGLYNNSQALYITSLQVDPLNPARLYAGTYGGFYAYEQVSTPKASINISTTAPLSFNATTLMQSVTLTNAGVVPLSFFGATVSGKFTVNTSCPPSLAVGSSCTLSVQYQPATASDNGSLSIATSDPASPIIVALSGTSGSSSSTSAPILTVSPSTLGQFTSATPLQTVRLSNTGTASLVITDIIATGSFTLSSSCPSILNQSISCTLLLQYVPKTTSSESSLLVINSNDPAGLTQIALNGVPDGSSASPTTSVSASPTSLSFTGVPVASLSAVRAVKLTNPTAQSVALNSVLTDNPAFIADWSQCNTQMAAYSSCTINVAYTPVDDQAVTASLKIMVGGNSLLSVVLAGTSADQTTMTGTTYGSNNALTLTGNFFFSSREKANTGNLYVMGLYNGQWYSFDGFGWALWLTGQPRTYGPTATYASTSLTLFNRIDISQLKGAQFFLGYGAKISDVTRNQTFTLIYTAP